LTFLFHSQTHTLSLLTLGAKHLSKNWKNGLASQLARRGNVYKLQPLSDGTHAWLLLGPNVFRIKPEINATRKRTTGNSNPSKENVNSSISKKKKKKKRPRITYRFGDNESDYEFETQEMTQWVHAPKNAEDMYPLNSSVNKTNRSKTAN
jgi:hypothetical protein